ncbi:F-box/kelch-repeat protein At3g23880-like [Rutidosis leptorrhynchoides]|uniref:F-box/kelch-repeat protein At3g23880-like n=1 Tax=Rutidosis leptorrhynchoides TaxID=125765 RepID=UPI003A99C926
MSHLPHDILVNILSRLPAKSLGQFKSVCRYWFSLISSETFVKLHHHQALNDIHTNHSRIFIMSNHSMHSVDYESPACYEEGVDDDDAKGFVSLNNPLTEEAVGERLLGSCYSFIYFVCYNQCILLWNPTTQKTRLIPDPSMTDGDPFYGLGYVFSTDDYKMVRASCCISSKSISFDVFNLNIGYWKMGQASDIDIDDPDLIEIFFNGSLNWLVRYRGDHDKRAKVLSFDMKYEIFKVTTLPDCGAFFSLGDMKGCLYAVCGGDGADMEIWVMKEYGAESSWSKVIKLNSIEFHCGYQLWPVCFTKEGDDVIIDIDSWTMVRYNLSNKTIKMFKFRGTYLHDWLVYHQTLVSS